MEQKETNDADANYDRDNIEKPLERVEQHGLQASAKSGFALRQCILTSVRSRNHDCAETNP